MPEAQRFLEILERELSVGLPASVVSDCLDELSAHLKGTVEAYREIGQDEAAAVRTMGSPRLIAQRTLRVAADAWERRRLGFAAFALAGFGANLAGISLLGLPILTQAVAVLSVGATFGVAFASLRARRPNLPTIFPAGAALVLPLVVAHTALWLDLPYPGGRGSLPRRGMAYRWNDLVRRPEGEERRLALRDFSAAVAEPMAVQAVRQLPMRVADAASLVVVVGGIDLVFAVLGLTALTRRRRRGVA